jgi:hypothetical protein
MAALNVGMVAATPSLPLQHLYRRRWCLPDELYYEGSSVTAAYRSLEAGPMVGNVRLLVILLRHAPP